jgi:diacylglycerol kinase family enzyme
VVAIEELERLIDTAALSAAVERKRMLVIVNPCATTMSARLRNLVVAALHGRYEVEAIDTQARGHATDIGDIVDATEHLLGLADSWHPRRIDLGTANGRAFTYSSGFGVDAMVVKRIEASPELKRHRLREYFFVYATVETVVRHYLRNPPRMQIEVGGERANVLATVVQNGEQFTFLDDKPIYMAEGGGLDSGSLAGVALRGVKPRDIPSIATRLLSPKRSVVGQRQILAFSGVDGLRCTSVDGRAIPLHVDGDHIGDVREAVFGIRPGALGVVA